MDDRGEPIWPKADFSRVPYAVFGDQAVYDREQERIFHGPVWCYLGLEAEIPEAGDFRTTFVGNTSVVVQRAEGGGVHAFENRCAHRGATVVREPRGNRLTHTCVYHQWRYGAQGQLLSVPFERGVGGKGGMSEGFTKRAHCLRALEVAIYRGVIFGSFHPDVEPLEDYLGAALREHLDIIFSRPIEVLGIMRQRMSSNWKLYWENVNDNYHAGLLHQFGTTFGIFRATQEGGSIIGEHPGHTIHYSVVGSDEDAVSEGYEDIDAYDASMTLRDPCLTHYRDEAGNGYGLHLLSIFPSVVLGRVFNSLATRQIRTKKPDEFEIYWTYFGYADEDEELRHMRIQQTNLMGPAGLVGMEDSEVGVLIQRAIGREREAHSLIEMGGNGPIENQDHLAQDVPVRGFWKYYCEVMGYETSEAPSK
jgi:anthranilate 1,2-dioxygenase large subunit